MPYKDPAKRRAYLAGYQQEHREKVRAWNRACYQKNKAKRFAAEKERYHSDPLFRLRKNIRRRTSLATNGQCGFAELGCSIEELQAHLEKNFKPGMSWNNYGSHWHVDHIRPLSGFVQEDIIKGCHYTNLQPLWALENFQKGNK